jgi:hypothetical protein
VATTLRAWDAPSARGAAVVSADQAINGWMKRYGQQRLNRQLKRKVRATGFLVQTWAARATARGSAYESYGTSVERSGQGLQAQAQDIVQQQARMQMLKNDWAQKIKNAETKQQYRNRTRQYKREWRSHEAILKGMTSQYESGQQSYEASRSRIKSYKQRYQTGNKQYERAVAKNEAAVKSYNERYYPVTPGFSY